MELEAVEVKEAMLYPLPVKEATEAVEVLEAVEPVEVNLWTCVAEVKVGFSKFLGGLQAGLQNQPLEFESRRSNPYN
jgi:hypothetical protein